MTAATRTVTLPVGGFRIDPRKALAVGALCWLGFAAVAWAVTTGHARAIDTFGLMLWRGGHLRSSSVDIELEMVRGLTALGGILLRNLFALGAVIALLFLRLRRDAALLALTIMGGWIVNSAIKGMVGRARPVIVPHLTEASGASFPSGHSFNAAVVYIAMALAFAALSRRASVRVTVIACAVIASMGIAWSRVWLGVHWPSDVIAGWLGGAGWAFMASTLLHRPARAAAEAAEDLSETDSPDRAQVP